MSWKVHMMTSYLQLMTFLTIGSKYCNTIGKSEWVTRGSVLKNRPHLVTFHEGILVSLWTFQATLILQSTCFSETSYALSSLISLQRIHFWRRNVVSLLFFIQNNFKNNSKQSNNHKFYCLRKLNRMSTRMTWARKRMFKEVYEEMSFCWLESS